MNTLVRRPGVGVDLKLVDPQDVPRPRDEVRLRKLAATPLADGRRVRVEVELTPFLERPNLDLEVVGADGEPLARATVVEADSPVFSLTMHVKDSPGGGPYAIRGTLSYASSPPQDVQQQAFSLGAGSDDRS